MAKIFGVAGNDPRYTELCELLRRDGQRVFFYPEISGGVADGLTGADVVILPVPLCRDGDLLNCPGVDITAVELCRRLRPGQLVLAGQIPPAWERESARHNLRLTDYLQRESYAVGNAAFTADAAILLTLQDTRTVLTGRRALVIGFGRIGKILCRRLDAFGVHVTASARRAEDLAWIRAFGWTAVRTGDFSGISGDGKRSGKPDTSGDLFGTLDASGDLSGNLNAFDLIYNTVPAPILDKHALRDVRPGCFLMDLASRPGIDLDAVKRLGLHGVWERGLPGRCFPSDAARILRDAVYEILRENGDDIS